MTKKDLVEKAAQEAKITKSQADKAMNAFLAGIKEGLEADGRVSLVGFGTFKAKELRERDGRNPATGESIRIPARRVVRFSAGKALDIAH